MTKDEEMQARKKFGVDQPMAKRKVSYEQLEKRMADVGFPLGSPENADAVKQYGEAANMDVDAPASADRKYIPKTMPSGASGMGAILSGKGMAKGGMTASKRADGCAVKGKTKGRFV